MEDPAENAQGPLNNYYFSTNANAPGSFKEGTSIRPFEAKEQSSLSREREQNDQSLITSQGNPHALKLNLDTVKRKDANGLDELNCFKTVKITERSERSEQTNAESKLASI